MAREASMFDFDVGKLLLIGVVALIFIPPKDLPNALRQLGRLLGQARRMAADFRAQFNEALREAEMRDLKDEFTNLKQKASVEGACSHVADMLETRWKSTGIRHGLRAGLAAVRSRVASAMPQPARSPCRKPCLEHVPLHDASQSRTGKRSHDPGRHRRHQGAADRAPDRVARAADQGAGSPSWSPSSSASISRTTSTTSCSAPMSRWSAPKTPS